MRDAWIIVGISLALFTLIEVVLTFAFFTPGGGSDDRANADTYAGAEWPLQYFQEFHESNESDWSPYVYWRRKPYHGEHINVDAQGVRASWNPEGDGSTPVTRPLVFFFGGSTMWGSGARDDFTIPSSFSRQLAAKGLDVRVVNFSESGYVSTQEVIFLARELQRGNIPDLVIFLDGVNDTYSAYQQGRAGLTQNEFNRAGEFKASVSSVVWSNLSTVKFVSDLFAAGDDDKIVDYDGDDSLAESVLALYENNIDIVNALADHYAFDALFYWQPTIFGKRNLTEYEQGKMQRRENLRPFFDLTYDMLRERGLTVADNVRFADLGRMFSARTEPVFIDWCHLGETGNRLVAERLVADALGTLRADQ